MWAGFTESKVGEMNSFQGKNMFDYNYNVRDFSFDGGNGFSIPL